MRRTLHTASLLLFAGVYLCVATAMLIHSRTLPPSGIGTPAFAASTGSPKAETKPFWLQRRHLPLRSLPIFVDVSSNLPGNLARVHTPWIVVSRGSPAGEYHSFRSSLLDNKAPPVA